MQSLLSFSRWSTTDNVTKDEVVCDKENQENEFVEENQPRDIQFFKDINKNIPNKDSKSQEMMIERLESRNADLQDRLEDAEERIQELQHEVAMLDESDSTSRSVIQKLEEEKAVLLEQIKNTVDTEKLKELEQEKEEMDKKIGMLEQKIHRLESANSELQSAKDEQVTLVGKLMDQLRVYKKKQNNTSETPARLQALRAAKKYVETLIRLEEAERCTPQMIEKGAWQQDDEATNCNGCERKFGAFLRRHHCRMCGELFCNQCCKQTILQDVSLSGNKLNQRTCECCVKKAGQAAKDVDRLEAEKIQRQKNLQSVFSDINLDVSDTEDEVTEDDVEQRENTMIQMSPLREEDNVPAHFADIQDAAKEHV